MRPQFVYYIATSLDGFIATPDGGVDWLIPFQNQDYGTEGFMDSIGTVILGRSTFEQMLAERGTWDFPGKQGLVLTRNPPEILPAGIAACPPDPDAIRKILADKPGDYWVLGGSVSATPLIEAGMVDRYEIFVMPVLLGQGLRLFQTMKHPPALKLDGVQAFPNGVAHLRYQRA